MGRKSDKRTCYEVQHSIKEYLQEEMSPEDAEAFAAYQCALADRQQAVCAYEQHVRALSPDGLRGRSFFDWIEEPFPWQ